MLTIMQAGILPRGERYTCLGHGVQTEGEEDEIFRALRNCSTLFLFV